MLAYIVTIIDNDNSCYRYEAIYSSNDRTSAWKDAVGRFGVNVVFITPGLNEPYEDKDW
jgi:hypothetical protein